MCRRRLLRVTFRDWREKLQQLVFHDVAAYSWDDGDAAVDPRHRDDCSYLVLDSPWLVRHRAVGPVDPSKELRHFKLCFNAAGVIQVLASWLEVQAEPIYVLGSQEGTPRNCEEGCLQFVWWHGKYHKTGSVDRIEGWSRGPE
jgi:hypothetical protein